MEENYSDIFVDFLLCKDKRQEEAILQKLYELESKKEKDTREEHSSLSRRASVILGK